MLILGFACTLTEVRICLAQS